MTLHNRSHDILHNVIQTYSLGKSLRQVWANMACNGLFGVQWQSLHHSQVISALFTDVGTEWPQVGEEAKY